MNTLVRIILTSLLSILMLSCDFALKFPDSIDGNGKVTTVERTFDSDFDQIKISQGLELYITQSNNESLSIETDENLHELIKTEVKNNTLTISTTKNIRRAASKKVLLRVSAIKAIKATSGSSVFGTNTLEAEALDLNTTSGADITLQVKTELVNCQATSGSVIIISGSTNSLMAQATSGSGIKASDLRTKTSKINATSGADISTHTLEELTASTSSGGSVRYSGNPEKVNTSKNTSGSIKQQ